MENHKNLFWCETGQRGRQHGSKRGIRPADGWRPKETHDERRLVQNKDQSIIKTLLPHVYSSKRLSSFASDGTNSEEQWGGIGRD